VSKAGSIFSLWTTEPVFSNSAGTINFGGGVPNPGFTGTAGKIATITFKAETVGTARVTFTSGAVLANDGKGTNVIANMGGGSYTISVKITEPKEDKSPEITEPTAEKKEAPAVSKPTIISPTHPDQTAWYLNNDIRFKWELPYGTTGVSILLNDKPDSNPGPNSDGLFSTREYQDVEDGVWYLHLKLRSSIGWSGTDHYKAQIDTTPPQPFNIEVDTREGKAWPILNFKAIDVTSGIDRYEVKIDGQALIVKAEDASLEVPVLPPGQYTVIVRAIDKADNKTLAFNEFTIEPIEAPVIENYPRELRSSDQLFISGTALPDVTIDVSIQNGKTGDIIKRASQSDKNGNWYLVYQQDILANGRYFAWAEAINSQGMKSEKSEKISFLVTPPVFIKVGFWVINYFTVFILLLIFTLLIVSLLSYWAGLIRSRLKEETDEVQIVLHKNLKDFKKLLEKEMNDLEKLEGEDGHNRERAKVRKTLKTKINFVEKKVLKEIKDIEDLLK